MLKNGIKLKRVVFAYLRFGIHILCVSPKSYLEFLFLWPLVWAKWWSLLALSSASPLQSPLTDSFLAVNPNPRNNDSAPGTLLCISPVNLLWQPSLEVNPNPGNYDSDLDHICISCKLFGKPRVLTFGRLWFYIACRFLAIYLFPFS